MQASVTYVTEENFVFVKGALAYLALGMPAGGVTLGVGYFFFFFRVTCIILCFFNLVLSLFPWWRKPNLITGPSGW